MIHVYEFQPNRPKGSPNLVDRQYLPQPLEYEDGKCGNLNADKENHDPAGGIEWF